MRSFAASWLPLPGSSMRQPDLLAMMLVLALLSGCVSSGQQSNKQRAESNAAEAAQLNLSMAQGYMQRGEYEIALDRLQKAEALAPKSADVQTMLAYLHEQIRRPEKADRYYRRSIELAPENGVVLNNYGGWLCRTGRAAEADIWFQKALDDPFYKTPEAALVNAGRCALFAQRPELAERYFRQVLDLDPKNPSALENLAALSLENNEYLKARAFLQRREGLANIGPEMLDLGYRIETALGNSTAADKYSDRLREQFPDYRTTPRDPGPRP